MVNTGSGLLIVGQPLMFTKELAVKTSVHLAVFLQQTHFMISRYGKDDKEGVRWLRWPHDKWHKKVFPFWGPATLRRFMYEAMEKGWLVSVAEPGTTPKYAIDYERLEAEFTRGRVIKTISPQGDQNEHPRGDQKDHPVPRIERETEKKVKEERTPPTSSAGVEKLLRSFSPSSSKILRKTSAEDKSQNFAKSKILQNGEKKKLGSAEDLKSRVRGKHHEVAAKKLSENPQMESMILYWRRILADYNISTNTLSFNEKERGIMRSLLKKFAAAMNGKGGNHLGKFMEFAVANWAFLRTKIVWEDNPKRSRLSAVPTIKELYYAHEDILYYMANQQEVAKEKTHREVFTDASKVPVDHPKRKQILAAIERSGQAVFER